MFQLSWPFLRWTLLVSVSLLLDKQAGRDVVEIMQKLAREEGATVLLVTHDSRILDVADKVLQMEDGRIQR